MLIIYTIISSLIISPLIFYFFGGSYEFKSLEIEISIFIGIILSTIIQLFCILIKFLMKRNHDEI